MEDRNSIMRGAYTKKMLVESTQDAAESFGSVSAVLIANHPEKIECVELDAFAFNIPVSVLYNEIFVELEYPDLAAAFTVCKLWCRASEDEFFWERYVRNHWEDHFAKEKYSKPKCKVWQWVCRSKRKLTAKMQEKFTGIGCYQVDDKRYEGEWVDGKPCGFGCLYWPNTGDRYEGEVKDGMPNGYGILVWGDGEWKGDRYEGLFLNNKRHGRGKYMWPNGDYYEGEYVNNKEHGKGVYRWASGTVYEGDFFESKQHGFGVHTWASGNKYVGEYVNDKQHGKGTHYWTNGNRYEGEYVEDKKQGKGKFIEYDGWVIDETWVAGLPTNLPECLHPQVRDCIANKMCTYTVTKQKARGQVFYPLAKVSTSGSPFATKSGQKPPRVCAICAELCVPKMGGVKLQNPIFGGSLICDCGCGLNGRTCSTLSTTQ